MSKFDVGIIGAGVAGCFAALKIQRKHKLKTIVFDIGRPFSKRRRQLEGALGCFPNSDGKLYVNNFDKIKELVDGRTAKAANYWVESALEEASPLKLIKDNLPANVLQKRIKEHNFTIKTNDYYQWKPESIHKFSKIIASDFENSDYIKFSFDDEVFKILKKNNCFHVFSKSGEFQCKKLIFCPGRTGWRWATEFYKEMGLESKDDTALFGVRFEMAGQYMKELNGSHCTLDRDDCQLGPFSWNGTIVPEDHADLVTSSFRSNEDRWKSEKVSFALTGKIKVEPDFGVKQTERMANLTYLLFNDRVSKEKIRVFLKGTSQLNLIPEYKWLAKSLEELELVIPGLINRGFYYVPSIQAMPSEIKLNKDLSTELDGLFVAGESANIPGLFGAALSGAIAADSVAK